MNWRIKLLYRMNKDLFVYKISRFCSKQFYYIDEKEAM